MNSEQQIVLFCVVGATPAVLTETAWALVHENPRVIPHRIVVITTLSGQARIERELFQPLDCYKGRSAWQALLGALKKERIDTSERLIFASGPDHVKVLSAVRNGQTIQLDDIRTGEDSVAVGDYILEQLRALVFNPDISVIASLSGGRKSMSALMLGAMTLIGRETDRLIHILVSDPFDNYALSPKFYFPSPARHGVPGRATIYTGKQARLELSDIPFVPLRNRFDHLGESPGTYSKLVEKYRKDLKKSTPTVVKIRLNIAESTLEINGDIVVIFQPRELLCFHFLLQAAETNQMFLSNEAASISYSSFLGSFQPPAGAVKLEYARTELMRDGDLVRQLVKAKSSIRLKLKKIDCDILPKRGLGLINYIKIH